MKTTTHIGHFPYVGIYLVRGVGMLILVFCGHSAESAFRRQEISLLYILRSFRSSNLPVF